MDEKGMNFALLAIVAIVAIVALVVLLKAQSKQATPIENAYGSAGTQPMERTAAIEGPTTQPTSMQAGGNGCSEDVGPDGESICKGSCSYGICRKAHTSNGCVCAVGP